MKLKELLSTIEDLIFVPKCASCRKVLPIGSDVLCDACRAEYENSKLRQCGVCGLEFPRCRCVYEEYDVRRVKKYIKLFKYDPKHEDFPENKLIYSLKRHDYKKLHRFLAGELASRLTDVVEKSSGEWSVTYPPRSMSGIRKYGFDHMEALAIELADALGIEMAPYVKRVRGRRAQKKLDRKEREMNAAASYAPKNVDLKGKRILLVDDIVTSGATMKSITKLLYKMGAREVAWASLGVTKLYLEKRN